MINCLLRSAGLLWLFMCSLDVCSILANKTCQQYLMTNTHTSRFAIVLVVEHSPLLKVDGHVLAFAGFQLVWAVVALACT